MSDKTEVLSKAVGKFLATFLIAWLDMLVWNWRIVPLTHLPRLAYWDAWAIGFLIVAIFIRAGNGWNHHLPRKHRASAKLFRAQRRGAG